MKISGIRTGYVGLVTSTCLAETGNNVICIDINKAKAQKMQNDLLVIYVPGLDVYFTEILLRENFHLLLI